MLKRSTWILGISSASDKQQDEVEKNPGMGDETQLHLQLFVVAKEVPAHLWDTDAALMKESAPGEFS